MATYSYIDSQGRERTVEAPDANTALSSAQDIARTSGVQLVQPAQSNTINLGQIDTTAVPLPNSVLQTSTRPTVSVDNFVDNPNGTTTNFLSDGTQDTGTYRRNPDGTLTFIPQNENEEQRLLRRRSELENEISTLENRISTSAERRDTALREANVFEDTRRLNELRAEQRRIEDREIEIPIEARQELRGRGATTREFAQTTTPRLESQALEALAASRNVSALTDTINTNIALIDSRIKAEKEADEFIYNARLQQLNTIESAYSTLLSDQQKLKLEEQKAIAAAEKESRDREWAIIEAQAKIATERGDFSTASQILSSGSAAEAYRLNGQVVQQQRADEALGIINQVDKLLTMPGLSGAVGASMFSRGLLGTTARDFGSEADYIAEFNNFASKATQDALAQAKAKGMALGVLSDKDIQLFEQGALAAGMRDSEGRIKMSEKAFKEMLNGIKAASARVYIASAIGQEQYNAAGWRDASTTDVIDYFNTVRTQQQAQPQGVISPYQSDFGIVGEVIRQEEGFSPTAYRDAGGWSIGFGSQTLNGQPVQPGMTISPADAERLLAEQIQRHSNYTTRVTRALTPTQQAALASFEYNLGPNIWNDPDAARVIALVNAGDFAGAGRQMALFNRSLNPSTGVREINPTLVARRAREANLLLG